MTRTTIFILAMVSLILPTQAYCNCVVLLHGLARTSSSMNQLESALTSRGFIVANVDYPSRSKTIEELAPIAVDNGVNQCEEAHAEKINFVTHSLGGILIRYYLENNTITNLGRVVMLAPPSKGSEVVDNLADVPGFAFINGPAGLQLGTDPNSVPSRLGTVNYPVGIIAGKKTFNPILSQFLPNPDDGKVSVERTKINGMADFIIVDVSHPFIMKDKSVIAQTIEFLDNGAFNKSSIPE